VTSPTWQLKSFMFNLFNSADTFSIVPFHQQQTHQKADILHIFKSLYIHGCSLFCGSDPKMGLKNLKKKHHQVTIQVIFHPNSAFGFPGVFVGSIKAMPSWCTFSMRGCLFLKKPSAARRMEDFTTLFGSMYNNIFTYKLAYIWLIFGVNVSKLYYIPIYTITWMIWGNEKKAP